MWQGLDGAGLKQVSYGKGKIIDGLTANEVLSVDQTKKDFSYSGSTDLDYIHRTLGDGDLYFIRNGEEVIYSGRCTFRTHKKYPELWDPSTGDQYSLTAYTREADLVTIPLELPPGGSHFIVFTDSQRSLPTWSNPGMSADIKEPVSGPWNVTFPEGWGAPTEASFDELISWTDSDEDGIRYFSGTATYHNTLFIDEGRIHQNNRIFLDLGEVRDLSEVFINGTSAGILWKKPYLVDISDLVTPGENQAEIQVVNLWVNRLTGDMLADPGERYCRTNHPYVEKDNWAGGGDETYHLQSSGLLGPVEVLYVEN
jgi:hypothetical protein